MTPVPVAMVGLGQWGPNLLRNLAAEPRARLAIACDSDPRRLEEFRAGHPGASFVSNFEDVVADAEVAAVVLATPAGTHEELAERLLLAGKDVLVEKPLALTLAGARRLHGIARERRRILMSGHTFLFNPAVLRVKELLDAGELGTLRFILASRLSLGQLREDVNALWNLAPHDVSIINYWLGGAPVRVQARGAAYLPGAKQEDVAFCVLEYPGGILANVQVSWLNPVKVRQMTVVGSEKMIVYDDTSEDRPLVLYDCGTRDRAAPAGDGTFAGFRHIVRRGGEQVIPVAKDEPLAREIAHFIECVATRTPPARGGEDALDVIAALEACQTSMRQLEGAACSLTGEDAGATPLLVPGRI